MKKAEDSLASTLSRFSDCSLATLPKGSPPKGEQDNCTPDNSHLGKLPPDNIIIFMMSFDYVIKFVGENFRHPAKNLSLFHDKVFPNKVTIILPYPSTFV